MTTIQIESRTVIKDLLIALVAVAAAALAREVVSDVRDTLRWLVSAIFLSLALAPAVAIVERISVRGHNPPRWLAILTVFITTPIAHRHQGPHIGGQQAHGLILPGRRVSARLGHLRNQQLRQRIGRTVQKRIEGIG